MGMFGLNTIPLDHLTYPFSFFFWGWLKIIFRYPTTLKGDFNSVYTRVKVEFAVNEP